MASNLVTLEGAFSKGLNYGKGDNLIPKEYSNWLRNIRINNGGITLRNGYETVIETTTYSNVAMIVDNPWIDTLTTIKLFFVAKKVSTGFFELCYLTSTNTIATVGTVSTTALLDDRISYVIYENFLIILIGNAFPFVYDKLTNTITQLTNAEIPTGIFPKVGGTLGTRTVLGLGNTLYFSQQVLGSTSVTNCYKYIGGDSKENTLDGRIIGILQGNDELYVFTTLSIYRISYNIGSNQFVTDKLGDGGILANQFSASMAGNKVFYLTIDGKVKTLQYQPGIVNQMIGDLSDTVLGGIDELFIGNDDSFTFTDFEKYCFSTFDNKENLIKFYLPNINIHKINPLSDDLYSGTCIIWDLVNQGFLIDDNKAFGYQTYNRYATKYFPKTGVWDTKLTIYLEKINLYEDRETFNIMFEFQKIINLGNPAIKKNWRGINISGKINDKSDFYIDVIIDDKLINTYSIKGLTKTYSKVGYYHFNHVITQGNLRNKGNVLKLRFYTLDTTDTTNYSLILDYLDVSYLPVGKYRLGDKRN